MTTILTNGAAYYTTGIHPEENPSFDPLLAEKYHLIHLEDDDLLLQQAELEVVDVFVEHETMVHAAFSYNPAKDHIPYAPTHNILKHVKEFTTDKRNDVKLNIFFSKLFKCQ